jgi:hypothetical protein
LASYSAFAHPGCRAAAPIRCRGSATKLASSCCDWRILPAATALANRVEQSRLTTSIATIVWSDTGLIASRDSSCLNDLTNVPSERRRDVLSRLVPKEVLRVLLQGPLRPRKVVELAEESDVSIGWVSAVRQQLIAHEWALSDSSGFRASNPNAVLDAWGGR